MAHLYNEAFATVNYPAYIHLIFLPTVQAGACKFLGFQIRGEEWGINVVALALACSLKLANAPRATIG